MRLASLALLTFLVPCASHAQGILYTDSAKRFTVQVPEGWTTQDLGDQGVRMNGNGLAFMIFPLTGLNSQQALTNTIDRISGSWTKLEEIDRQYFSFGGQVGTWVIYEGTDGEGKPGRFKAVGVQGGGVTAGVLIIGDRGNYTAGRGTIEATLATLRLGTNAPLTLGGAGTVGPVSPVSPSVTASRESRDSRESRESRASPATQTGLMRVTVRDIDPDDVDLLDLDDERGALVDAVESGSPAEEAGLQESDVILRVDRNPVENAAAFERLIGGHKVGDSIELAVLRQGERIRVIVKLK